MTDAELRTIEFLMTSDAATPADLPDWLLMFVEGDGDEPGHELITVASLMYIRRGGLPVSEGGIQVSNSGVRCRIPVSEYLFGWNSGVGGIPGEFRSQSIFSRGGRPRRRGSRTMPRRWEMTSTQSSAP